MTLTFEFRKQVFIGEWYDWKTIDSLTVGRNLILASPTLHTLFSDVTLSAMVGRSIAVIASQFEDTAERVKQQIEQADTELKALTGQRRESMIKMKSDLVSDLYIINSWYQKLLANTGMELRVVIW